MKKVNIVTYCTKTSIGSILQSYAISSVLGDIGYDSSVWLEDKKKKSKSGQSVSVKKRIYNFIRNLYRSLKNKKIKQSHQKRMMFIDDHIKTERFFDYDSIQKKCYESKNDVYLAGSDQIWNLDKCDPVFFLDFAHECKKISYAASMGKTEISQQNEEKIKKWIDNFEYISVRENECKESLESITNREISVHLDPTFLIDFSDWRKMEKEYKVKRPYILMYMLYWDNSCKHKIIELKKRTGLDVYAICPDVSRVYADYHLYDVGIEEFLWLVDHAEYVVTSSFHGVAFSIIFQKKFAAVVNPSSPSRINNIMRVLDLPFVPINELDSFDKFKYDKVYEIIKKERIRSIEYLRESIG